MKRFVDIFAAGISLVVLSPVLLLLVFLVRCNLGRPVVFRQFRPGLDSKPFCMYKFRTMINAQDCHGNLLSDAERLTRFGKFLRKTSLDELPELWNVLKGDMSLVGPRPLLMEYLPLYNEEQRRRHEVRPGITGWAQVNGRNAISWEDKFKLDLWYVDNQSYWLDLKIIFFTVAKVFSRDGINQPGHETAVKFKGDNKTAMTTKKRFLNWQYLKIEEGIPTKYHWVVQNIDGLKLGYLTDIGVFSYINAKHGVIIEDEVQIGSHCSIYSVSTIDNKHGKVVLKRNCKVGSHSTIMPGVTIGENAIVGAHSFVTEDIPGNCLAVGVPAKIVKKLSENK